VDAWLLEDLFEEEERLKSTRKRARGHRYVDFTREDR